MYYIFNVEAMHFNSVHKLTMLSSSNVDKKVTQGDTASVSTYLTCVGLNLLCLMCLLNTTKCLAITFRNVDVITYAKFHVNRFRGFGAPGAKMNLIH